MRIIIQSPELKPRKSLVNLVHEKINKLEQYSQRIQEARVLLKLEKSNTRDNKICEVQLMVPGNDLFAKRQAETFEEAVHWVSEALNSQVKTWQDKVRQV